MSRKTYTPEALSEALDLVKHGTMTAYKASKVYHVPKQTLLDKVKNKYTKQSSAGAPTILSSSEEDLIVKWVQYLAEIGFPITRDQLIYTVSKLVKNLNRPNKFKNGLPGRHWYEGFLNRNPTISQRVSQTLTTARLSVNEGKIRAWFERVHNYLEEKNLLEVLQEPSRIFNCDESAFFLCPKGQGVLVRKGAKQVYSRSGNDEKECLTLCLGASAVGKLMPVFALFPYKRIPQHILAKYPKKWAIGRSDSGWMTCQTFYEYVTNVFHPFLIKENIKKPIVLFLDGHSSHLSLPLSEFCRDNGIILTALLPNSTHLLQPMDVAVFHSLKNSWRKIVYSWRMENDGRRLKREEFGPLLEGCIESTLKPEIIQNGFRTCGLFPFDTNVLNYAKILKSTENEGSDANTSTNTDNYERPSLNQGNLNEFANLLDNRLGNVKLNTFLNCGDEWVGDIKDENLYYLWKSVKTDLDNNTENIRTKLIEFGNSTLEGNFCTETFTNSIDLSENVTVIDLEVQENGSLVILPTKANTTILESYNGSSIETASGSKASEFPNPFKNAFFWPQTSISNDVKKHVKRKLTPTVAIADEYIEYQRRIEEEKRSKLEKIELKKKTKEAKGNINQKRNKISPKTSSDFTRSILVGDYVVITYEGQNFPGIVTNMVNEEPIKYEVKTMTMSGINWRWPDQDDILMYDATDILKKINPPLLLNNRGVYVIKDFDV